MKKVLMALALALGLGVAATPASAALFVGGVDNDVYFFNFENLYDSTGTFRSPNSVPVAGDYLVGIINVQNIQSFGADHWQQNSGLAAPTNSYLSGVFAQEIVSVTPDILDPTQLTIVFKNPTLTTFCKAADCFGTGLAAGEMMALYLDSPATTNLESNGTLLDDVTKATDDTLLISFGLSAVTDAAGSSVDLTGLGGLPEGAAFGALSVIQNNTGFTFDQFIRQGFFAQMIFTSEFERNPNGIIASGGTSPWEFRSNDPAALHPSVIPEPSSMLLLGLGTLGAGVIRRKKLIA